MKKIIKLAEGDTIPDGAKLLHTQTESEFSHYTYHTKSGLFITTDYKRTHNKEVPYFYYEVETDAKDAR